MRYLFGSYGLGCLKQWCKEASSQRVLLAFDFDGTLAPIVSATDQAEMTAKTRALLQDLSELSPLAIVSGRSLVDLRQRVAGIRASYVGNHGLEGIAEFEETASLASQITTEWKAQIREIIPPEGSKARNSQFRTKASKKLVVSADPQLGILPAGVQFEDKGYSLALHYRGAKSRPDARKWITMLSAHLVPAPRIILGKAVLNFVPPDSPDKGCAILKLKKKCRTQRVFFIGDDYTDEDVFSLPRSAVFSVRVGRKLTSQARFYVHRQGQIQLVLQTLVDSLS